jgi:hypothetical protein
MFHYYPQFIRLCRKNASALPKNKNLRQPIEILSNTEFAAESRSFLKYVCQKEGNNEASVKTTASTPLFVFDQSTIR